MATTSEVYERRSTAVKRPGRRVRRTDAEYWLRDPAGPRRPYGYLRMRKDASDGGSPGSATGLPAPNAGTVGSAPTFDVKKKRRRRSMKVTKTAFYAGVKEAFVAATLGTGLGILAVYDALRAQGHEKDVEEVRRAITTGKLVDSRKFVKKIDPKITVATTKPEIDRALSREPNLSATRRKVIVEEVSRNLQKGTNAYAFIGERGSYIFAPKRTSAAVLGHEVGHVMDFRKRGLNYRNQGPYEEGLASAVWKPSHESSVMTAEREAWRRSPSPDKNLEQAALGSYEKSFHARRALLAGSASAIAFTAAMLKAAEMTPGEYEREVSATGVSGAAFEAHRRPQMERRPGNQKSGLPMWVRYSKNLRSPSTWNFGDKDERGVRGG